MLVPNTFLTDSLGHFSLGKTVAADQQTRTTQSLLKFAWNFFQISIFVLPWDVGFFKAGYMQNV